MKSVCSYIIPFSCVSRHRRAFASLRLSRDFIENGIDLFFVAAAIGIVVHIALLFGADGTTSASASGLHLGFAEVLNPLTDAVDEFHRPSADVGAATLHPTIPQTEQNASDVADLSACIASIEAREHSECKNHECKPLHLDPNDFDEKVKSYDLLRLVHTDGDDEGADGTRCPDDIGIHSFQLEIGEDIVAKQEEETCEDAAGEVERQQLTAGVGSEEELAEPPQPKHIENYVERILTKVCVAEHVGEERPGMH